MNISFSNIAPAVLLVIIGSILTIIGATGAIPIGNPQLEIKEALLKNLFMVIGLILILGGFILTWYTIVIKPKNTKRKANSKAISKKSKPISKSEGDTISIEAKTNGGDFVIGTQYKNTNLNPNQSKRKPKK